MPPRWRAPSTGYCHRFRLPRLLQSEAMGSKHQPCCGTWECISHARASGLLLRGHRTFSMLPCLLMSCSARPGPMPEILGA